MHRVVLLLPVTIAVAIVASVCTAQITGDLSRQLCFERNEGQFAETARFVVRGRDRTYFFTDCGVRVLFPGDRPWAIDASFVGSAANVRAEAGGLTDFSVSVFRGDEEEWVRGARTYRSIVYRGVWPGVDVRWEAGDGRLKQTFVLAPGVDPSVIAVAYRGATKTRITDAGALELETPAGTLVDEAPIAWQNDGAEKRAVRCRFTLRDAGPDGTRVGFAAGSVDPNATLVIDPMIYEYCGYIGGSRTAFVFASTVDASGCLYVTGVTSSDETMNFPLRVGPQLKTNNLTPAGDVFVAKLSADGRSLVFCGFLSGPAHDEGDAIAVDSQGAVYIAGIGGGSGFPHKGGPAPSLTGSAFFAKIKSDGSDVVYCGALPGSTYPKGIAVDTQGAAYLTGWTDADQSTFPVTVGPDLTFNSPGLAANGDDAFVAKIAPGGTHFEYCGYIGGTGDEEGLGIQVDALGRAYVCGAVRSNESTFPVTVGPDLTFNGPGPSFDGFVARVNATGTALEYCGYIGGDGTDAVRAIAVDSAGNAYVTGSSSSTPSTFPLLVGPSSIGPAPFVAKVDATGSTLHYCGYIPWTGSFTPGIAVDRNGAAYVAGLAGPQMQAKVGPQTTYGGNTDGYVGMLRPSGTDFVYLGWVGGANFDELTSVAVDPSGNVYVGGHTRSDETTLPVAVGPDLTFNTPSFTPYWGDALVAKISLTLLETHGTTRPGDTVALELYATADPGQRYQLGSSFGTGPIAVDTRTLGLAVDALLWLSTSELAPAVFQNYRGSIGLDGRATAALAIPVIPALVGTRLHTAFVTLDALAPSGVASISNTATVQVGP